MLIKVTEHDILPHEDLWGVLAVINDHYDRHPEAFGDEKTRKAFTDELAAHQKKYDLGHPEFYKGFAELLKKHDIHPFAHLSLAFVGGWREGNGRIMQQTIARAMPIVEKFGAFHDISYHTKREYLSAENALTMTGNKKVDYVVTGNVLNAPDNFSPDDTIIACGNLLKKGGRAFHLLAYGESKNANKIGNPDLEGLAGQRHLYNVPPGAYRAQATIDQSNTQMMVLEQDREIDSRAKIPANQVQEGTIQSLKGEIQSLKGEIQSLKGKRTFP